MMRVALTGGIACGKSLFSCFLKDAGANILDADDVVHQLESSGGELVPGIVHLFGHEILASDGSIDRKRLAARVFADEVSRLRLNALVHPVVRAEISAWQACESERIRIAVIPLLYESGWGNDFDVVICLTSSEENQIQRMMKTRGMSVSEARMRLAAQMPVAEKAARANYTIENNADVNALAEKAAAVYHALMEKKNEYR